MVGGGHAFAFGQQVKSALGVVEQDLPLGGEAHGAGGALEQARAQLPFQPLEGGAGGGGCHAQGTGSSAEGAGACGVDEHMQVGQVFDFHKRWMDEVWGASGRRYFQFKFEIEHIQGHLINGGLLVYSACMAWDGPRLMMNMQAPGARACDATKGL